MRTEIVNIDPVDLCDACPKRGNCKGVARRAIETYMKQSFFTITVPKGDPEFLASVQYLDDEEGESENFLPGVESFVEECGGPAIAKRHLFKANEVWCGGHLEHMRQATAEEEEYRKAVEKAYIERNGEPVMLSPDEMKYFTQFTPAQISELSTISIRELNELILFCRKYPDKKVELQLLHKGR